MTTLDPADVTTDPETTLQVSLTKALTKTQPGIGVLPAGAPTDLETRIAARRAETIATLIDLKKDVSLEGAETRTKLKAQLSELAHIIKTGVVDGWASLNELVTARLERWLAA